MLLGTILNLFIGLALTFAFVGLVVSAIAEVIATVFKWRSNDLRNGLKQILNDPGFTGLARAVLDHGAVNPTGTTPAKAAAGAPVTYDTTSLPSYIDPRQFAGALMDILQTPTAVGQPRIFLPTAIQNIADPQLKAALGGFYDRAAGDVATFQADVAKWFDNGMDRLSGAYKRRMQLWTFLVGLIVAIGLNIDAFQIAEKIWEYPQLSTGLQIPATADPGLIAATWSTLVQKDFPVGWAEWPPLGHWPNVWVDVWSALQTHGLGWLFTAVSVLFGAPFWFDTLQKLVQVRGTGRSPNEK